MANIKNHLNNIKNALFGQDVRGSIHDGIDAINKEVESTTGRQEHLEDTFDQLVINSGNSNAEIVDARVGENGKSYAKLGDRLDSVDSQLEQITTFVTPEMFGAIGDGVANDSIAIKDMHDYANEKNLKVYYPPKKYFLRSNLGINIKTEVDFGDAEIILNEQLSISTKGWFTVLGDVLDFDLSNNKTYLIEQFKRNASSIPILSKYEDCSVYIEDVNDTVCIRSTGQTYSKKDMVYISKNGKVVGDIYWEFSDITNVTVKKSENYLVIKGGVFVLNSSNNDTGTYINNGFTISRDKTIFKNMKFKLNNDVTNSPSLGFINIDMAYDITLENIELPPRYAFDDLVGTYALNYRFSQNIKLMNVTCEGTGDNWGAMTGNYVKDLYINNSNINRIDTHFWLHNLTMRDSNIGEYGIHVAGSGKMLIENCMVDATGKNNDTMFINLRSDYGARWDGDIIVRDSTFKFSPNSAYNSLFRVYFNSNYDTHDFVWDIKTGTNVLFDNIKIECVGDYYNSNKLYLFGLLRELTTKPLNNIYLPKKIHFKNISVVNSNGVKILKKSNLQNYSSLDEGGLKYGLLTTNANVIVENADTYHNKLADLREDGMIQLNSSGEYEANSYIPKFILKNVNGSINCEGAMCHTYIENSVLRSWNGISSTNRKSSIEACNCKIKPNYTGAGTSIFNPNASEVKNHLKFTNCYIYVPIINNEKGNINNLKIIENDIVTGVLNNLEFDTEFYSMIDIDKILAYKNSNSNYSMIVDSNGFYSAQKTISNYYTTPKRGYWLKGERVNAVMNDYSSGTFGWICIKSGVGSEETGEKAEFITLRSNINIV